VLSTAEDLVGALVRFATRRQYRRR
jgi:hypothetical protein